MLTLSRKPGQSIVIGNDIVITVKDIRGKTVRLSIEAPKGLSINREEVHREIVEENRRASQMGGEMDDRLDASAEHFVSLGTPRKG